MVNEVKIQVENKGRIQLSFKTILYSVLLIVGLTLSAVIAFNLGKDNGLTVYRKEFKAYQDTVVTPALVRSDSLNKELKSLIVVADSAKNTAQSLTTQIDKVKKINVSLRTQNEKLSDKLKTVPLPPECDVCKNLVTSLETEVDSLSSTVRVLEKRDSTRLVEIGTLRVGLSLQTSRADSLYKVVINFPEPPKPKKFLSVELSKRTLFIVGLVIGGAAVGAAK
jgi:hypothetical protein